MEDPEVDMVYIATPPSSHLELALQVAKAGEGALVEKPMAMNSEESKRMVEAFDSLGLPLFVAYYRRALPRFVKVKELLQTNVLGTVTSVELVIKERLKVNSETAKRQWRYDPKIAGGGLFFDLGSHCLDILDFLLGPIDCVAGISVNTARVYEVDDCTSCCFRFESGVVGTALWNFNAFQPKRQDVVTITGTKGILHFPVFDDESIFMTCEGSEEIEMPFKNPPYVHQPLVQTIVDQLTGTGVWCSSTGHTALRTAIVMDKIIHSNHKK